MRKICLITTSRADYGIQSNLIKLLQNDSEIDFSLIVSGSHMSKKHGETYREIENDGIKIAKKIDIGMDDECDLYVEHVFANAVLRFSAVLREISPDIVVLLGDRYEMLAAAFACCLNNIPIAHLHGGETTEGATDEAFRHSITKMAHLHFTSCKTYRNRVIQLGEDPERVFNVGAMGVENALNVPTLSKEELEKNLGIKFLKRNLLVTFHPVTLEKGRAENQIDQLLAALSELKDTMIVFTHPNADAEGKWALNSAENIEAIEYALSLVKNGYTNPNPATQTRYDLQDMFGAGKVAMMIGPNNIPTYLSDGGYDINYDVTTIPANEGCESVAMGAEQLEDSMEEFFSGIEGQISGKTIGLFGSYDWGDGQMLSDWGERVKAAGANLKGIAKAQLAPDSQALEDAKALLN